MRLDVINYRNGQIFATENVTGNIFTSQNSYYIQLGIHVTIKKYEEIELESKIVSWIGTLSLHRINDLQTGV